VTSAPIESVRAIGGRRVPSQTTTNPDSEQRSHEVAQWLSPNAPKRSANLSDTEIASLTEVRAWTRVEIKTTATSLGSPLESLNPCVYTQRGHGCTNRERSKSAHI